MLKIQWGLHWLTPAYPRMSDDILPHYTMLLLKSKHAEILNESKMELTGVL